MRYFWKSAAPCGFEAAGDEAFKRNLMIRHSLHKWTALLLVLNFFSNTQGQTIGAVTARQDASSIVISVADLQDANLEDLYFFYSLDAGRRWITIPKNCLDFEADKARWDVLNCLNVDEFEGDKVCFKVGISSCISLMYDGYSYHVVQVGNQCWFAENLRTSRYRNGDEIPVISRGVVWASQLQGARSIYLNDEDYAWNYGYLYNWYAISDNRGLCPSGWHVPSDEEWMKLENHLGMSPTEVNQSFGRGRTEGAQMKASPTDSLHWNGINSSGFSCLPGGYRDFVDGKFHHGNDLGYWWSSSQHGTINAWYRFLSTKNSNVARMNSSMRNGFSVRCVRD